MDDFFFPAFERATVVAAAEAKMVAIQSSACCKESKE
jgi:hypothetical protein